MIPNCYENCHPKLSFWLSSVVFCIKSSIDLHPDYSKLSSKVSFKLSPWLSSKVPFKLSPRLSSIILCSRSSPDRHCDGHPGCNHWRQSGTWEPSHSTDDFQWWLLLFANWGLQMMDDYYQTSVHIQHCSEDKNDKIRRWFGAWLQVPSARVTQPSSSCRTVYQQVKLKLERQGQNTHSVSCKERSKLP